MPVTGTGRIVVWEGASLWMLASPRGRAEISPHAHHAIQITFQLAGGFEVEADGGVWSDAIVAVRSDAHHVFRGGGAVAFLFVEPESIAGRRLSEQLFGDGPVAAWTGTAAVVASRALQHVFETGGGEAELLDTGRAIVAALAAEGESPSAPPDRRVSAMIAFAAARIEDGVALTDAAAHICLSPSRARHLFAAETGLPFKSYLLWLRLERAVALYAAGRSLTESAHLAGFADSAHLSRTFRRTFGLAAAELRLERAA